MLTTVAISLVAGILLGFAAGFLSHRYLAARGAAARSAGAQSRRGEAEREAKGIVREAEIQARAEVLKAREAFEASVKEQRRELNETASGLNKREQSLVQREENLDRKADVLDRREESIEKKAAAAEKAADEARAARKEADAARADADGRLERLAGMTRARVFDIAANGGTALTSLGYVPYAYVNDAAPTNNLSRVGYYIELKRKDTDLDDYHDLTRWIWVSCDAFGDRTLADVGIPLTTVNQCAVNRLRVISNMPGIESTAADENNVRGWVEFWPSQYNVDPSGKVDAPAKVFRCDWNDKRSDNMSGYGSMQVHDWKSGATIWALNNFNGDATCDIGIGNNEDGDHPDWTFMHNASRWRTRRLSIFVQPRQ